MKETQRTVGVISLGCSKNLVDTEVMLGLLEAAGFAIVPSPGDADVLIVNTCGFIEPAKQESIDAILEMAAYKKGRCDTLVVTGCLSQRYGAELREALPEVDLFLGVRDYETLPELLGAGAVARGGCELFSERTLATPPHYAYLRIADGCDNRCSFCAIPLIRGDYASRSMEDIVAEAEALVSRGAVELNVVAQDITRYGRDIYGEPMLCELLRRLERTSARWLRLLYTYSDDITDELITTIANSDKIVNYIDMPIQHCDDGLIARMNRRGTRAQLLETVRKLREIPGMVIRTSLMVGFPGETDEMFESLRAFVRECRFDRVGIFAYSSEEGTAAAEMTGAVDDETKERRRDALFREQQAVSRGLNEARVGQSYDVLIDGVDAQSGLYVGRSYAEAPQVDGVVYVRSEAPLTPGEFVRATITRSREYDLWGEAK